MTNVPALAILFCLAGITVSGSCLDVDVKPNEITEGITPSLTVNCSFSYDSTSGIANLISLIISNNVGQKNDSSTFTELVSSSTFAPDTANFLQPVKASAKAHMIANGMSFLSLTWAYPTALEAGRYRCVAHGIDKFGHSVETSQTAGVTVVKQEFSITEIVLALTRTTQRLTALEGKVSKCESTLESLASLDRFVQSREFNGSVYLFSDSKYEDATRAAAICILQGGYLVEINDLAEHNFIADFLNTSLETSPRHVLTGATARDKEENWEWRHSNQPLTNTSALWAPGSPLITSYSNHRCALLERDEGWLLSNSYCSYQPGFAYLCETPDARRH